MPPPKGTRKAAATKSLEQTLWEAADKVRGNLEAAEHKHVALGLVFLKSVQAGLRAKVKRLLARYDYPPDKDESAIGLVLEQAQLFADAKAA